MSLWCQLHPEQATQNASRGERTRVLVVAVLATGSRIDSVDQFEPARHPALAGGRFERLVEAEDGVPGFARRPVVGGQVPRSFGGRSGEMDAHVS